ncbi:hypothetical protein B0O80DRAFT_302093 [Mortierella sp. GBAus27b]|nr:hypothetical protein BGX31_005935 [Mortierella sp. GBA43]KAI8356917.1 hypothetical protein B0O80DRAFT_302093 [Mortierella sp. GBAus27b]
MSSTDTPAVLKRKASDSDTVAGTSDSNEQQHDSKRARKDLHADDCEDDDCEGCAEGEIVLQFDTPPSAVELFQMAREEASKPSALEPGTGIGTGIRGLSRMAKALFDKAIEEFEALDKANAHIEMNDGTEVGKQVLETKLHHAACVVAVGNYMPSFEMLQEGTIMFEELAKRTDHKHGDVLVGLGIAEISQARELRRQAMKALELEEEDEDEEEASEERHKSAALVGKTEINLVQRTLEHFQTGLNLLKDQPDSAFAQESIRAAQELEEYGISLDLKINTDLATRIFDQAIQHLEGAQKHKAELVDASADVLTIWGSSLHSKARIVDNQSQGDGNPATALVEKAIEILVKAEGMQDKQSAAKTLEAVGQAYLMSTGLIEDEDLIMERFDAATEKLSCALELDPDNDALRAQVEALRSDDIDDTDDNSDAGASEDDPEEEYYEDDEGP